MKKGSKHSEETKIKMKQSSPHRKMTEYNKEQILKATKGRVKSPEECKKISLGLMGHIGANKGGTFTEEQKERMRIGRIGIKFSEEHKNNIRKAIEKRVKNGIIVSEETRKKLSDKFKGRVFTEEWKEKIRLSKLGSNNASWRGGVANNPYPEKWNNKLRNSIRERDNFECKICNIKQEELTGRIKKLSIHHIDYNKNNLEHNNLITLCSSCHVKTNSNRNYWISYFKKYYEIR